MTPEEQIRARQAFDKKLGMTYVPEPSNEWADLIDGPASDEEWYLAMAPASDTPIWIERDSGLRIPTPDDWVWYNGPHDDGRVTQWARFGDYLEYRGYRAAWTLGRVWSNRPLLVPGWGECNHYGYDPGFAPLTWCWPGDCDKSP